MFRNVLVSAAETRHLKQGGDRQAPDAKYKTRHVINQESIKLNMSESNDVQYIPKCSIARERLIRILI
jgi:hypothetical protein